MNDMQEHEKLLLLLPYLKHILMIVRSSLARCAIVLHTHANVGKGKEHLSFLLASAWILRHIIQKKRRVGERESDAESFYKLAENCSKGECGGGPTVSVTWNVKMLNGESSRAESESGSNEQQEQIPWRMELRAFRWIKTHVFHISFTSSLLPLASFLLVLHADFSIRLLARGGDEVAAEKNIHKLPRNSLAIFRLTQNNTQWWSRDSLEMAGISICHSRTSFSYFFCAACTVKTFLFETFSLLWPLLALVLHFNNHVVAKVARKIHIALSRFSLAWPLQTLAISTLNNGIVDESTPLNVVVVAFFFIFLLIFKRAPTRCDIWERATRQGCSYAFKIYMKHNISQLSFFKRVE